MLHKLSAYICLCLLTCATLVSVNAFAQRTIKEAGIAVIVNDGAITHFDIQDRINLIIASSGLPNTADTKQKLLPQIVNALINERVQLQEAKRLDIVVPQDAIDGAFADLAKSNNMTAEQFETVLKRTNAPIDSLRKQLEARIAWSEVFAKSLRRRVRVSDTDVQNQKEALQNNIGSTEYLLSEIFLPVENPKQQREVLQLANKVVRDLKDKKTSFANVARQLSKSAGAERGGALGWIAESQLDEELRPAIQKMRPKSLSQPIKSVAGYHIFYLSQLRQLTAENIPNDDQIKNQIFGKRAERVSQSRLQSLRSSAFIDNRLIEN